MDAPAPQSAPPFVADGFIHKNITQRSMRIFFGKHSGKDTSELDSGYLLWIIEKYEKANWTLIQECKKELSERLKLEWTYPPKPLTQKEIIATFKRDIVDKAYAGGTSTDDCTYISSEHTSWLPPPETENMGDIIIKFLDRIEQLKTERDFLFDVIGMSTLCKGNPYIIDGYLHNKKYMYSILKQIKEAQILRNE